MQSTNVNRTLQSGYSEMMGLYPPGEGAALKLSSKQVAALASGKGMPPMSIRNTAKINTDLGFSALPFDFVSVPIATYMTLLWKMSFLICIENNKCS